MRIITFILGITPHLGGGSHHTGVNFGYGMTGYLVILEVGHTATGIITNVAFIAHSIFRFHKPVSILDVAIHLFFFLNNHAGNWDICKHPR